MAKVELRAPIKTLAVLRKSAACGPLDGVLKGALNGPFTFTVANRDFAIL